MNSSPSITADTPTDYELKFGLLDDVYTIIDVEGKGRRGHRRGFDLVYNNGREALTLTLNLTPNTNPNPNPNRNPNPLPNPNPNRNPKPNQVKPDKAACYSTRLGCYEVPLPLLLPPTPTPNPCPCPYPDPDPDPGPDPDPDPDP